LLFLREKNEEEKRTAKECFSQPECIGVYILIIGKYSFYRQVEAVKKWLRNG
jgi:hypothetical protein